MLKAAASVGSLLPICGFRKQLLVRHIVLGSGPRPDTPCMGIHAHPAVSSMVLGPFRKDALGGL